MKGFGRKKGEMKLSEAAYYKFKARMMEVIAIEDRVKAQAQICLEKRKLAFEEAGLDTNKSYTLNDTTLTVNEQVALDPLPKIE